MEEPKLVQFCRSVPGGLAGKVGQMAVAASFVGSDTDSYVNPLSFEDCCVPLYKELVNYGRRLAGGDVQRASDVVQEALIRAMRAWPNFVPESTISLDHAVRGWLYCIVRNSFMKAYHADRRRREYTGEGGSAVADSLDRDGFDPRDALESAPGDEVLEAVARLSPHHRQVVEMHYLEERPIEDIALQLGIAKTTVHTRLNRARAILKTSLRKYAGSAYGLGQIIELRRAVQAPLESSENFEPYSDTVDGVVAWDDDCALERR